MVVADLFYEKSVFEILQWLNYKGCLSIFVVILRAGVVSLPSEVWKSLV